MPRTPTLTLKPGSRFRLSDFDPDPAGDPGGKAAANEELASNTARLHALQERLYAEQRQALLIVLQAMDTAGKDGTIEHVCGCFNPQGVRVASFKAPTEQELAHDFLWRIHRQVPRSGMVGIFNRSHYEDVLVVRVHDLVPKAVWSKRYAQINDFEKTLADNGTHILKFYLHIDPEEQLERFKQRIDDPARHWKISEGDYAERPFWDAYTEAFQDAIGKCSTEHAPWFIIPSNHKWFRNLAISRIVAETLESLGMKFPEPTVDIAEIKQKYHAVVAAEGGEGAEQTSVGEQKESADASTEEKSKKGKEKKKGKE